MTLKLPPKELVMHLALGKAQEVAEREQWIIIGADTFIVHENILLGKPKTPEKAIHMLQQLSGTEIEVYSGLAIISGETTLQDYAITKIQLHDMSIKEIKTYVATGEPLNRAGAIAIQGKGGLFVKSINGCYFNVLGIPLTALKKNLRKLGIHIFSFFNSRL